MDSKFNLENESFDITNELWLRKKIEQLTGFTYTVEKNPEKYEIDLQIYHYVFTQRWCEKRKKNIQDHTKTLVACVEVETAKEWKGPIIPPNWYEYSIPKRKIYEFDDHLNEWTGPRSDLNKKYYFKLNADRTNAFCQRMDLIQHFPESKRNKGTYHDDFFSIPREQHYKLQWGIENIINYILNDCSNPRELEKENAEVSS